MDFFSIVPFLKDVFAAPVAWFASLFSAISGATDFWLAGVFIFLLIVVFIMPLRGGALSDRAKKTDKRSDDGK